jgi:hypothetical protein
MSRLTLGAARPTIARAMKVCSTDATIPTYVNEAQERLINKNKWQGTFQRYQFCIASDCITLPRQIQTIEAFALCDTPGIVRNQWYEFTSNGNGLVRQHNLNGLQMLDRGDGFVTFDDVPKDGTNKLRVYADRPESATARLLVQGYDENANWIRTTDNGTVIDGEYITISTAPRSSVNYFSAITGIIKPVTQGTVRLFGYNPVTVEQIALGYYENDEERPSYRRAFVPGLTDQPVCCNRQNDNNICQKRQVTVMAKLRHIPVVNDNDWLIVANVPALKTMILSILKEERDLIQEAQLYEQKAIQLLEEELSTYLGDGMVSTVRVQDAQTFGGGGCYNYT